ncbi:FBP domain-containing protein [Kitasatospora sp. LaBMicrA B282]|uniref:FBP domain-containing protein n=1 Tax=Kitasatospora sp. LaBMicrA B282 TaxID=3420949 RepID=UPI003D0F14BD
MKALTERDIRTSFVNCSKGEAGRLAVPRGLAELPWEDLDFLGWRDPGAPERAYLVLPRTDGLTGVALRYSDRQRGLLRRNMCSLCLTTHAGNGVSLMAARKAGAAGREGNSVGAYMCTDLACPLYIRGKRALEPGARIPEALTTEQQIERMMANLAEFVTKLFT